MPISTYVYSTFAPLRCATCRTYKWFPFSFFGRDNNTTRRRPITDVPINGYPFDIRFGWPKNAIVEVPNIKTRNTPLSIDNIVHVVFFRIKCYTNNLESIFIYIQCMYTKINNSLNFPKNIYFLYDFFLNYLFLSVGENKS